MENNPQGQQSPMPNQTNGNKHKPKKEQQHIRIGTFNIRSGQSGNLECALRELNNMNVDVIVITETKITNNAYTHQRFRYSICASKAQSTSCGGIAFAFCTKDNRFVITQHKNWGPDVLSIVMTTGQTRYCLIGVYIPPSTDPTIYHQPLDALNCAISWGENKHYKIVVMGDINIDLRGRTGTTSNPVRAYSAHDTQKEATITTLTTFGLEDVGKRYKQHKSTGLWTWAHKQQGQRIQSICEYILMQPSTKTLWHRIRQVHGVSTDHRIVYTDIPTGDLKLHRKNVWRVQQWPIPEHKSTELDLAFNKIKSLAVKEQTLKLPHPEWISPQTWRVLCSKATLQKFRTSRGQNNYNINIHQMYKRAKRSCIKLIQCDHRKRMNDMLETAEKLINNDPKRAFQILSVWYKRKEGINLPLAPYKMRTIKKEYGELYQAHPIENNIDTDINDNTYTINTNDTNTNDRENMNNNNMGEITRWDVADHTPTEEEIRSSLKSLRNRKAPGPSGICVENLKTWRSQYETKMDYIKERMPIPTTIQQDSEKWLYVVKIVTTIFTTGKVPSSFQEAVLVLIPKTGSNKYRGILLLECLYKLCSAIINKRIIANAQWDKGIHGFR